MSSFPVYSCRDCPRTWRRWKEKNICPECGSRDVQLIEPGVTRKGQTTFLNCADGRSPRPKEEKAEPQKPQETVECPGQLPLPRAT